MIKYDLGCGYIKQLDENNWAVCRMVKNNTQTSKYYGKMQEKVEGYYPRLDMARRGAIRIFGTKLKTHKELEKLVSKIEKI